MKLNTDQKPDDAGSCKKNGGDARNVSQRPRRTKIQKEMNNTLEGLNSKITEAEEMINDLEDRMMQITATEQNIEKRVKRNGGSITDL